MKLLIPIVLVGAVVAVIVLASGGGSKHHNASAAPASGQAPPPPKPPAAGDVATVMTRQTSLGRILVDGKGRTLYLFEADKPNMSTCSGACASIWPLDTTGGKPAAATGASAARLGTIAGPGGKREITYNGWPLYYYAGDRKPGDTAGQGLDQFGAKWYVVAPSGHKIDND
jgi:predicted lipoprotein with Yx(FWY)xxD motif